MQTDDLKIETVPLFSMREMDNIERDIRSDERRRYRKHYNSRNVRWCNGFWILAVYSAFLTVYAFALYVANGELQDQPVIVELGK